MSDPHPLTVTSIDLCTQLDHPCGCLPLHAGWPLCEYHQGYDDGIEAYIATMCGPK
jgi:hypothetical protein